MLAQQFKVLSAAPPKCTKPFPQIRNAAQQEDEEEHADSIWKTFRLQALKKGLASSFKMDFMRLLNDLD
jgi:hypothetical protein